MLRYVELLSVVNALQHFLFVNLIWDNRKRWISMCRLGLKRYLSETLVILRLKDFHNGKNLKDNWLAANSEHVLMFMNIPATTSLI